MKKKEFPLDIFTAVLSSKNIKVRFIFVVRLIVYNVILFEIIINNLF